MLRGNFSSLRVSKSNGQRSISREGYTFTDIYRENVEENTKDWGLTLIEKIVQNQDPLNSTQNGHSRM